METWDTVKIQAFRLQEWPEGREAHCKYLITFGPHLVAKDVVTGGQLPGTPEIYWVCL
jgi:hypothetical protein